MSIHYCLGITTIGDTEQVEPDHLTFTHFPPMPEAIVLLARCVPSWVWGLANHLAGRREYAIVLCCSREMSQPWHYSSLLPKKKPLDSIPLSSFNVESPNCCLAWRLSV